MAKKSRLERLTSLDESTDGDLLDTAIDIGAGFTPLQYPQAARDFERARRSGDAVGMGLAGLAAIPVVGGLAKVAGKLKKAKQAAEAVEEAPAIINKLYPESITGTLYKPGDKLPKYGIRNVNSEAELAHIIESGYMLPGGQRLAKLGSPNVKYFTMTDTPKGGKRQIRVPSEYLPHDRAVRAEHVEIFDPATEDWVKLKDWWAAKQELAKGGSIENTTHYRKII